MPEIRCPPLLPNPDEEREWLRTNMQTLQAKVLTANLQLPAQFRAKLEAFDINERNSFGESLLIAAVKYVDSGVDRVKYVNLLLGNGIDVNVQDQREKRTALMYTCVEDSRTTEGKALLCEKSCNLALQDRLGNTAMMYAAMKGRDELMNDMVETLSKGWGLGAIQLKNCMGYTAEDLAIKNEHHRCARILQSQRLHMLSCLNRQLDMVGRIGCRHWCAFTALYKCVDKWKPRQRRKSAETLHLSVQQTFSRKQSM